MDNKEEENKSLTIPEEVKQQDTDLISEIMTETDTGKLKDLTNLFNAFQVKRHILRVNALNDVQDRLVQQMMDRLSKYPDNFNNKDISDWMKTVQSALESSQGSIEKIDTIPQIVHQNNTQVNINVEDSLSRESREKILDILNKILPKNVENTDNSGVLLSEDNSETSEDNSVDK